MAEVRVSRRQVLKVAAATGIATTSPWWLVNKSHAQRAKKLIFWQLPNFTPIADQLQKDQFYEFAKSAGLKDEEVEFSVVGNDVFIQKLSAGSRPATRPTSCGSTSRTSSSSEARATWSTSPTWSRRCARSPRGSSRPPWRPSASMAGTSVPPWP